MASGGLLSELRNISRQSGDANDPEMAQFAQALDNMSEEDLAALLEAAGAGADAPLAPGAPPRTEIVPKPGFVVKSFLTHKTDAYPADLKVFINVCQSSEVPAPPPLSDSELEAAFAEGDDSKLKVPISLNEIRADVDKAGRSCIVLDACVHTTAISHAESSYDYKVFLVDIIITHVEQRNNLQLSRDYALPKLRAKGPLRNHIIARARRPVIEETAAPHKAKAKSSAAANTAGKRAQPTAAQAKAVRQPTYRVLCEPPDGRPEFMVVEVDLPGVSTTSKSLLDLERNRLLLSVPGLYSLDARLPWPADTEDTDEAAGAQFDRRSKVLTVTVRVLPEGE